MNRASGAWARERVQWEIGLQMGSNAGGAGGLAGGLTDGTLGIG